MTEKKIEVWASAYFHNLWIFDKTNGETWVCYSWGEWVKNKYWERPSKASKKINLTYGIGPCHKLGTL